MESIRIVEPTAPNQVWSWDITKLLGPVKWTYFYLYVILDILSRYVGLDGGQPGEHRPRQASARRQLRQAGCCCRTANDSRRPRAFDEIEGSRHAARRISA